MRTFLARCISRNPDTAIIVIFVHRHHHDIVIHPSKAEITHASAGLGLTGSVIIIDELLTIIFGSFEVVIFRMRIRFS